MKKQKFDSKTIAAIGVMAALVFITTKFMRIPIPVGAGKTQIHVGNSMCILAGLLFGPVPGGLAAGIGTALVDLMDPRWAPEFWVSFINKFVMGFTVGAIARMNSYKRYYRLHFRCCSICSPLPVQILCTAGTSGQYCRGYHGSSHHKRYYKCHKCSYCCCGCSSSLQSYGSCT